MATQNTDVTSWLMYNIKAAEQTDREKFGIIYDRYKSYCSEHNKLPATESCLSAVITKLHPSVTRSTHSFLHGIQLVSKDEVMAQGGEVTFPDYCEVSRSDTESSMNIKVPTKHVVDGKILHVDIKLVDGEKLSLCVDGINLNLENLGISESLILNQNNINGILNCVQNMVFCKGKEWDDIYSGKRIVQQKWSSINDRVTSSHRVKGRTCIVVMSFVCGGQLCTKCKDVLKKHKKTAEKENSPSEGNTHNTTSCSTSKPVQNETCTCTLSKESHEDLMEILNRVMPNCPDGFRKLLESQVKVISNQDKDPRSRRWDPDVISLCLSLWNRSPQGYQDLKESGFLTLPSGRTLQYHKNSVSQKPGFSPNNLKWMQKEATRRNLHAGGRRGGLIIDEVSIQDDLQVVKKGDEWTIVGACDLGDICNSIRVLREKKKQCVLATQVLQFLFCGYSGFRWPVAFFPTTTAAAYELYILFWEAVDILGQYGFTVDHCSIDGASTNRLFIKMHFPSDPKEDNFTVTDIYDSSHKITFVQDIKHTIKKIRNGLASRNLVINDTPVVWEHWVKAFEFNKNNEIRIHRKLTHEHVYLTPASKMRNHLAAEVLNEDMLYLMRAYAAHTSDQNKLKGTISILEKTSILVSIFSDCKRAICTTDDNRLDNILQVLDFFLAWEQSTTDKNTLLTEQTRQDITSSLLGFVELTKRLVQVQISVVPGYLNSDPVENFFCQQRGLCNGMATNPTISQYGPAVNSIILGQSTVSKKGNTGQKAEPFCAKRAYPLRPDRQKGKKICV